MQKNKMQLQKPKSDVFHGIADPTRRDILRMVGGNEMSIAVIKKHFSISRNAVNKHLNVLFSAGLVEKEKIGRETRYILKPQSLLQIKDWLKYFDKYWDEKLQALKELVESEDQ